jgi:hypothetical protein
MSEETMTEAKTAWQREVAEREQRDHERSLERIRLAEALAGERQTRGDAAAMERERLYCEAHMEAFKINAAAIDRNTDAMNRIAQAVERLWKGP